MLPDLEGTFEPVEAPGDQLDAIRNTHLEATREIITEQELRKTYYKLAFKQVQYGTYRGKPACVLVVEVDLRAPERGRHRFKGVSIEVEFLKSSALDTSVEVLKFAPETVYGRSITEHHSSNWAIACGSHICSPSYVCWLVDQGRKSRWTSLECH